MSKAKSITEYALPHVRQLHAYTPGFQPKEDGWIKLNTNECPYGPSVRAIEAGKEAVADALRLYPDPRSEELRSEVGRLHGVGANQVIIGNGSDDILNLLLRAFSQKGQDASFTVPSYSLYPVLCCIQNAGTALIPFDRSMRLPVETAAAADASILFLTSPNAPTGVAFPNADIKALADAFDGILVVDEAYADFAEESAIELLASCPNVVVTRTFSKSYALAGIRVGYAVGHPDAIDMLDRVRDSYNVNRVSQVIALAALKDQNHLKAMVGKINRTRDYYQAEMESLGWFVYPSQSNFIFAEPVNSKGERGPEVAKDLFEFLKSRKILVRYFPGHALTESFLRISVGDDDQMLVVSETIQEWLNNA